MALNRPQVIASAEKLVSRGKIEAAIKEYRKLLAENPNDASTLNRLGDLFARVERIDEAVRLFSQIADRYTDDGFFVKAIAIYKKIIKLDPTRLVVYERLAELYHRQGLIPEARTQYQVLVDYYLKHSNSASAVGILQRMAALVPDDPGPHVKLAELFHAQKLTDKALSEYRLIADLMLKHNKVDEATQVYAKAIEAEPGDIAFITDAVLGLKDAGHTGAAARLLALAVEKNPQAEKIARLAGLGKGAPTQPPQQIKVSDITHGGRQESEFLRLDKSVLEGSAQPAAPAEAAKPPSFFPPPRPQPPSSEKSFRVVEEDVELVLDIPEDLDQPSTQVSPTEEMLRRSPDSPWFEASEGVEFELEIEGMHPLEPLEGLEGLEELGRLGPVTSEPSSPAVAPPPAAPESAPLPPEPVRPAQSPLDPPAPIAPAVAQSSQPIRESISGFESAPESYEIDWSFEPEPDLLIPSIEDLPAAPPSAHFDVAGAAEATPMSLNVEELERTSFEVVPPPVSGPRRHDDLLAEAEVFRKYGLREKAHDRLRELLQANSRHVGANGLLVTLWIEEGKHDKALSRANQLSRLSEESGDELVWPQIRNRLVRAGFKFEGERVVATPVSAPKKKDKLASLLDDLAGVSAPSKTAIRTTAPKPAPVPADLPAESMEIAPARSAEEAPAPSAEPPSPPGRPAMAPGALDEELPEIVIPILPSALSPASRAFESASPATMPPTPPPTPSASAEPKVSPERIASDESLSWLDQAVATPAPRKAEEEKLFEEEEGFFDLAAELEQELSTEDLLGSRDLMPAPQEQSLEEIVEGFKRGVAESLSSEDYDTHYNLGIAYREMGLLDEAIGEFQLASKDPKFLVDCCSLLGGCFLEKGLPELAIKWYRRGLEVPNLPEEAFLGLLYDLGNVYLFQADEAKARATFVEIYGVNSNYRDVVAKLAELGAHH